MAVFTFKKTPGETADRARKSIRFDFNYPAKRAACKQPPESKESSDGKCLFAGDEADDACKAKSGA